jgi:GNAT superfamily N-acetyltransferase
MSSLNDISRVAERIERDAWLDLFAAAPDHVRERLGLASTAVAGMGLIGCRALPITELNRGMALGIDNDLSRDDMERAVAWLDANATAWALQIAPVGSSDLVQDSIHDRALVATGAGWAKFVWTDGTTEPLQTDAHVGRAEGLKAAEFGETVANGFGLPAECGDWFASLVGRPSWHCFLATVDGKAAGGGTMYVRDNAAWLGITGTLPEYRNRGIQRGLLYARTKAAIAMGADLQTNETGQPNDRGDTGFSSYRNQERAGFNRIYVRPNFKRAQ